MKTNYYYYYWQIKNDWIKELQRNVENMNIFAYNKAFTDESNSVINNPKRVGILLNKPNQKQTNQEREFLTM